jgi:hypothetical protein
MERCGMTEGKTNGIRNLNHRSVTPGMMGVFRETEDM